MQYRRKHPRYPFQVPVRYQTNPSKYGNSSCCDISGGGISFLAYESLRKGSPIQVMLPVKDRLFKRTGKVAYSNHIAGMNLYRTGVEFEGVAGDFDLKLEEQQSAIQAFREQLQGSSNSEVSEQEAARRWVEKYMRQFSSLF